MYRFPKNICAHSYMCTFVLVHVSTQLYMNLHSCCCHMHACTYLCIYT